MARNIELIARGVLVHGGKLLVCRNRRQGYCFLPGGHVEFGESAADALGREFIEECGMAVLVRECLLVSEGVFESGSEAHHEVNLVFRTERRQRVPAVVLSREPKIEFCWVPLDALAAEDFRPAATKNWLLAGRGQSPTAVWKSEIERAVGQSRKRRG